MSPAKCEQLNPMKQLNIIKKKTHITRFVDTCSPEQQHQVKQAFSFLHQRCY